MNSIILTFDVEDFMSDLSLRALALILKLLRRHNLRGLFFITGNMSEKLSGIRDIVRLLEDHEIGYHSSSHSVRPTIPEFTDVQSFSDAVEISLSRETSHIDPLTGEPGGVGGVKKLRETFENKDIVSFRAPGFCWTPPHLEALRKLGIKFDFSAKLIGTRYPTANKVTFKNVVFYPFPAYFDFWEQPISPTAFLISNSSKTQLTCFSGHDWSLAGPEPWDSVYYRGNPKNLAKATKQNTFAIIRNLVGLDTFLKGIKILEKSQILDTSPTPRADGAEPLDPSVVDVVGTYQFSMNWVKDYFNYTPTHVLAHFHQYFGQSHPRRDQ